MKQLKKTTNYDYTDPNPEVLDTYPNPGVERVIFLAKEFTSLCPVTNQPDYAQIRISYWPVKVCLESKSLKIYLGAYRMHEGFAEHICRKICDDLQKVLDSKHMEVEGRFVSRGGISIEVFACEQ